MVVVSPPTAVPMLAQAKNSARRGVLLEPERVVSDVEYALLSNPKNVASLERAIAESVAGEQGTVLA